MLLRPSFKSREMASRRALTSNDVSLPATSRIVIASFFRIEIVNEPLCKACPLRWGQDCTATRFNAERNFSRHALWPVGFEKNSRGSISLPHDHAQATPPALRKPHANDFQFKRKKLQEFVCRRMEAQRRRHKINEWRYFLQLYVREISIPRDLPPLQVLPHAQPVIRCLQRQVDVLAGFQFNDRQPAGTCGGQQIEDAMFACRT